MHPIEPLEARIAPATLLPGNKVVTYTDVDGDLVTIKASLPVLQEFQFVFDTPFDTEGPQQLRRIDFVEGSVGTFSVTMTVKRGPEGDGLANVGELRTDEDMETITIKGDLGRIEVGDMDADKPGLKALNVHSLGALGISTQIPGGTIVSSIVGGVGTIKVRGDVFGDLRVTDAGTIGSGTLGSISIGGSILGSGDFTGRIFTGGDIGTVIVKGSVRGGTGNSSGQINAGGSIENVVIGGSLLGNFGGNGGGQITDALFGSGSIIAGRVGSLIGSINKVTIVGDVHGGNGTGSGSIFSSLGEGSIGTVTVKGSIIGGNGAYSGGINTEGSFGKLSVGGSIVGYNGGFNRGEDSFGQVWASGNITSVKVVGDVIGGIGSSSGRIGSAGPIGSISIGGSLIGGSGFRSGGIQAGADLGKVSIKRNVDGFENAAPFFPTILATNVGTVLVGGFVEAAYIAANQQLGPVTIGGNLLLSTISGFGQENATDVDVAIKSIKVKGAVQGSNILGGYLWQNNWIAGNADAQIGSIFVGGDWLASSVSAGINGTNPYYGDGDDVVVANSNDPAIDSRIAKITIAGQVMGVGFPPQHFGFVAQEIGTIKVGGFAVKLDAGPGNDLIELSLSTDDVTIRELPTL